MNRRPAVAVTLVALLAMVVLSAWAAPRMPERVPMHWDLRGDVDRYGSAWEALVLTPLLTVGLSALLWFLPSVDPRKDNLRRSAGAYNAVWIATVMLLLVLHATLTLGPATTLDLPVLSIVPVALGVLFVVVGVYLPRTSSNWFLGVRTPWTLTSELSWRRTHRLAGVLFVVLGLALIAVALVARSATALVAGGGAALIALVSVVYSYLVWRTDAARGGGDEVTDPVHR